MSDKIKIIVDKREPKEVVQLLRILNAQYDFNVGIKTKVLEIADYVCMDEKSLVGSIGIERKTAGDFVSSIADGRLFKQILDMHDYFKLVIVAIVGDLSKVSSQLHDNSKYGALSAIVTKYGASIIHYPTEEFFAYSVLSIFKKCQTELDLSIIRKPKISNEGREIGSLSCAKGIGGKLAKEVLKIYRIRDLANIDDPNLISSKIKNIGKIKAQNLINLFRGFEDENFLSEIDVLKFKGYMDQVATHFWDPQLNDPNKEYLDKMAEILNRLMYERS